MVFFHIGVLKLLFSKLDKNDVELLLEVPASYFIFTRNNEKILGLCGHSSCPDIRISIYEIYAAFSNRYR
jgi:hypothetical protein